MTTQPTDNYNGMVNGPIYLDASLAHLFGEGVGATSDQSSSFEGELKEIFADGVIDQKDFDRYRPAHEYEKAPDAHSRYDRLRRLYVSLRRFASTDDLGHKVVSELDAANFNVWFENGGRAQIMGSPASNSELMGAMLFCGDAKVSAAPPKAGEDLYAKDPCAVTIKDDELLLVVHPNYFGQNSGASGNIEREIQMAKDSGVPSVVLLEPNREFSEGSKSPDGYINDHDPSRYVASHNGEHEIEFSGREVTMAGGYFDRCFQHAMRDLIRNFKGDSLTIRIPSDAVFNRSDDSSNPLLKGDIREKGRASIEKRLDFFMRLAMKKGNFVKEEMPDETDPQTSVIDWERLHFQNNANNSANEAAAPAVEDDRIYVDPQEVALERDAVCEEGFGRYVLSDDLSDFGLVFKDKEDVFFSTNCREGKPTVTIVFE